MSAPVVGGGWGVFFGGVVNLVWYDKRTYWIPRVYIIFFKLKKGGGRG